MRILRLVFKVSITLFLNHLVVKQLLGRITSNDFTPAKAILLRRLLPSCLYQPPPMRDMAIRLWITTTTIWAPIVLLDSIHAALAVLFICILRVDEPEDWPDLFGSPLEAFTLGRFWKKYVYRLSA